MSASGTVTVKSTKHTNLIFHWALMAQDAAQNRSRLAWSLTLAADAYGRINSSATKAWRVTVDGQAFSGTNTIGLDPGQSKTLAQGETEINHNPDGTKTFEFSFVQEFSGTFNDVWVNSVEGTGTGSLPTIPRASRPTAPDGLLGSPLTIATNRASSAFTHTLRYRFGEAEGLIAENVGDSAPWTPPLTLAAQLPRAVSGTAVITCETYSGGTLLGTAEASVTLTIPESVVPTVTGAWSDTTDAMAALGAPCKDVSALRVEVTAAEAYGSPITGRAVVLEGIRYNRPVAITGPLTSSGTVILTVTATDRRGRTGSASYPIAVLDYTRPALTLSASRCRADGTPDDTGEYATVTVTGHVCPLGGNAATLRLTYGTKTLNMEMSAASGDFTASAQIPAASTASLPLKAVLQDKIAKTTGEMTLSTGYATMDFLSGGRGIAFGKSATREGFDCAMPAFFENVNGMGLGALVFSGGSAQLPGRPGPYLMAFTADSGAYGLYLASSDPAASPEALRLGGALAATMQGTATGVSLTVTGNPAGLRGWYLG